MLMLAGKLLAVASSFVQAVQAPVTAQDTLSVDTLQRADSLLTADTLPKKTEIILPEALLYDVDSMLNDYNAKQYLKAFDCDTSDISGEISDSIYIERLYRLPRLMEMVYNDVVRSVIDKYTGRLRPTVSFLLGAANFYFPIFEEVLESEGLPLELKYLPVIESALRPQATSRAGAGGLWQFMVPTAKQCGLKVNSIVDERRDPFKSTHAAAQYLKYLYRIYGDWNLVIAAYNCGPGNINKAIARSGGKHNFWQIYSYLPRETRGYIPAFIAATYIMNFYPEHGLHPKRLTIPLRTDTIMVERNMTFSAISKYTGIDVSELRTLNPQYRADYIPGEGGSYPLCLPTDKMSTLIHWADTIFKHSEDSLNYKPEASATAQVGEVSASSVQKPAAPTKSTSAPRYHKVRRGETLTSIAARYGTTVNKLKKLNGLHSDKIRYGQSLKVR